MGIGNWSFAQAPLPPATVSFLDGSFLRGEVESLNAEVLRWRHPNARQPIEFSTTNLNLLRLPPRAPDAVTNSGPVCRVRLTSGDEFAGQLLALDGESFEVETWFAGRLRGQRAGLVSLAFANAGYAAFYEGPRAAEEWRSSLVGAVINRGEVEIFGGGFRRGLQLVPQMNPPAVAVPQFRVLEPEPLPAPRPPVPRAPLPSFTVEEYRRMSEDAERSGTVAVLLKTDLVQAALKAGQTSVGALERWFEEFKDPNEWGKDAAKAARFKVLLRAEVDVLVRRLQGRAAPFVEPGAGALPVLPLPQGVVVPPLQPPPPGAAPGANLEQMRAVSEVLKLQVAASPAADRAAFLQSDLMQAAVAAGLASVRAEEEWFAHYERELAGGPEALRTGQMKLVIQAESALLTCRLLKARAPDLAAKYVPNLEQMRERAMAMVAEQLEARGDRRVAAEVLAQARVRAVEALQAKDPDFAAALGAEAKLAGPAVARATTNTAWFFRDGAYYSTAVGTLGRECQLPTKARIEFDLAWKGQPYFRFSFYTRSTDDFDFNDGWQFYTSAAGSVSSMRRAGMGGAAGTSARVPQLSAKSTVRLTFLVNTETETITLLADGEQVHEWKNLGSPGPGTGITFYNYNATPRFRLSDIRISPWDGRVTTTASSPPTDADPPVEAPAADSAVVEFINKDRATGTLHGIREGRLSLTTAGNKLEIPLTRAGLIAFPANAATELAKVAGVQVTLHRNERLTLALEKWEGQTITAVSPVFGRLTLKPEAIRSLRFNPAAPRGAGDEWGGP